MTIRAKPITTKKRRSAADSERRQQLLVTIGFVAIVVIAVLLLIGSVAASYYNDHLKAVATVDGVGITRDQWLDRIKVYRFRINTGERRVREQVAAGTLDKATGQQQLSSLSQALQNVPTQAIQALIDETFLAKAAAPFNVSVAEAEIDAQIAKDATTPEQRHVEVMSFVPKTALNGLPSASQRAEAQAKAQQALAALKGGKSWADVAKQFFPNGTGTEDFGLITLDDRSDDPTIVKAVFALTDKGVTDVVEGQDGRYRIAHITEIRATVPDSGFLDELKLAVDPSAYRNAVHGSLLRMKVSDKLVADQLTGGAEQVHPYEIFVATSGSGSGSTTNLQVTVRASHILYSPKHDPQNASKLDPNDPAWAEAKKLADAAAATLNAITDVAAREKAFATMAKAQSDDKVSGANGGDLDFQARDSLEPAFADAIFDTEHSKGQIIGPVKTKYGYHVILWEERKDTPSKRIQQIADQLKQPGADFQAVAKKSSEGPEAAQGGDLGWFAKGQASGYQTDQAIFGLQAGGLSEPILLQDGYHLYKVVARELRPLFGDQVAQVRQNALTDWYTPQRQAAQAAGRITTDPSVSGASLTGQ